MNNSLPALGRRLSNATIHMHAAIAASAGLSGTDHKYLYLIVDHGPMTAGELALKAHLTTGAVTGIIDRLEKKDFVRRVYDKADRRKVLIEANDVIVKKLLSPLSRRLEKQMRAVLDNYTAEEQAVVERYLTDAIRAMQAFTDELRKP